VNDLPSSERRVTAQPVSKGILVLQMLVILAGGVWLAYGVFDGWRWQNVERNWASADGTIVTAYDHEAMGRHVNWETGWIYSYSVNGRTYEAKSTALSDAYFVHVFASESQAIGDENSRPAGSIVSVYYDPVEPQRSVLDPATDSSLDWLLLSVSGICIAAGIFGMFLLAKAIRKSPSGA
jgi:hypothetical protein